MQQHSKKNSRIQQPPKHVAIIGLGLLGGSLGKCLKEKFPDTQVLGYARRRETIDEAMSDQVIDFGSTDPAEVLPAAEISIVCLPVNVVLDFVKENAQLWSRGTIVTDVGSVKQRIVDDLTPVLYKHGVHFIGSHPMAGSEKTGIENASSSLYKNATVFVTPSSVKHHPSVEHVSNFWRAAGAFPVTVSPQEHDHLVAGSSHLIHLLAAAGVNVALQEDKSQLAAASGFRDFSRIASASPDIWTQIFRQNKDELCKVLEQYRTLLEQLQENLENGKWDKLHNFLSKARKKRHQWYDNWRKMREK